MFPKIAVAQNGWFIMMENLIKMDDLGVTPIFGNTHMLVPKESRSMGPCVSFVSSVDRLVRQVFSHPSEASLERSQAGR